MCFAQRTLSLMSSGTHEILPSQQHVYVGLPELTESQIHRRREAVFLVFAGVFLGSLAMLNILGVSKFIALASITDGVWSWGTFGKVSFAVAVGVLPYPITFLCTDFISELYGRRRASRVVWMGLALNLWVLFVLWLGGALPPSPDPVVQGTLANGSPVLGPPLPGVVTDASGSFVRYDDAWTFLRIRELAFGAVAASMIAYLAAQLVDVHVFHFWKRLTNGRHLWLRNNGSTIVSQLVDTTAVIIITHFVARSLPINPDDDVWPQLLLFIATGYVFKVCAAAIDTVPFYLGAPGLRRFLRLPPASAHA